MQIPRAEYPRPQFVRSEWMNLNGQWQFEIDNGRSGEARGMQAEGYAFLFTHQNTFNAISTCNVTKAA